MMDDCEGVGIVHTSTVCGHWAQMRPEWTERPRNTFVYQLTAVAPFELTVAFEAGDHHPATDFHADLSSALLGAPFAERLDALRAAFDTRFERTFGLKRRGYSPDEVLVL